MTRIVSKFGIAAALTLGVLSTAAAQSGTTRPTTQSQVSKGEVVPVKPETKEKIRAALVDLKLI